MAGKTTPTPKRGAAPGQATPSPQKKEGTMAASAGAGAGAGGAAMAAEQGGMKRRGWGSLYAGRGDLEALDSYVYRGVDRSLLSRYVLQPYWSRLVQVLPLWMAPNLVTLLGLCAILLNVATLLWYSPDLAAPCPTWAYWSFGLGLFFYTSMDAIDGKQARRTGTSSPLGELFDHGVDALNTSLGCLLIGHSLHLAQSWALPLFLAVSLTYFYAATWETYHTSTLYLGIINGPVEGTHTLCLVFCLTAYIGRDTWLLTPAAVWPSLADAFTALAATAPTSSPALAAAVLPTLTTLIHTPLNLLILMLPFIALTFVIASSLLRVYKHYLTPAHHHHHHHHKSTAAPGEKLTPQQLKQRSEKEESSLHGLPADPWAAFLGAVVDLLPIVAFLAYGFVWLLGSPADILHRHAALFTLPIGLEFGMLVGRITLAHLLKMPFPKLFPSLVTMLPGVANSALILSGRQGFLDATSEFYFLVGYAAVTALIYSHFVVTVINQLCGYLDINCLTIKKRNTN